MATRPLVRAVANDWPAVHEVRGRLQARHPETITTDPLSSSGALACRLHLYSACPHSPLTGPDITSSPIRPLQASTLAPHHPTATTTTSHLRSLTTGNAQLVTASSFRRAGRRTCIRFLLRTAPVSPPSHPSLRRSYQPMPARAFSAADRATSPTHPSPSHHTLDTPFPSLALSCIFPSHDVIRHIFLTFMASSLDI